MPRHRRRGARAGRLAAVVLALAVLPASVPVPPGRAAATVVVAQMNLCNSGLASSCYSFGAAVDQAAAAIRRHRPDVVAVHEVCRGDLTGPAGPGRLARAMADAHGAGQVGLAFTPAVDRDTGGGYRCTSGDLFGIALLARGAGGAARSGAYRSQDASDEARVWTCVPVLDGRLTGCTTHLSTVPTVARRQCRELVAVLGSPWVLPEVVVAADLNLTGGDCAPPGYGRRGDGSVQQILFSPGVRWVGGGSADLLGTDHPLLYGELALPSPPAR